MNPPIRQLIALPTESFVRRLIDESHSRFDLEHGPGALHERLLVLDLAVEPLSRLIVHARRSGPCSHFVRITRGLLPNNLRPEPLESHDVIHRRKPADPRRPQTAEFINEL